MLIRRCVLVDWRVFFYGFLDWTLRSKMHQMPGAYPCVRGECLIEGRKASF